METRLKRKRKLLLLVWGFNLLKDNCKESTICFSKLQTKQIYSSTIKEMFGVVSCVLIKGMWIFYFDFQLHILLSKRRQQRSKNNTKEVVIKELITISTILTLLHACLTHLMFSLAHTHEIDKSKWNKHAQFDKIRMLTSLLLLLLHKCKPGLKLRQIITTLKAEIHKHFSRKLKMRK